MFRMSSPHQAWRNARPTAFSLQAVRCYAREDPPEQTVLNHVARSPTFRWTERSLPPRFIERSASPVFRPALAQCLLGLVAWFHMGSKTAVVRCRGRISSGPLDGCPYGLLRQDAALTWGLDALLCWPRIALAADPQSEGRGGVHPQPKRRRAVALHKDATVMASYKWTNS